VKEVFELINEQRTNNSRKKAFCWNEQLAQAAQARADDMASSGTDEHTGGDRSSLIERATRLDYSGDGLDENMEKGQKTPADVVKRWMQSTETKNSLLSDENTQIGVGYNTGHWIPMFGKGACV